MYQRKDMNEHRKKGAIMGIKFFKKKRKKKEKKRKGRKERNTSNMLLLGSNINSSKYKSIC